VQSLALMRVPRQSRPLPAVSNPPRHFAAQWRAEVRRWLERVIAEARLDAGEVAARAHVSPSTVYRMLDDEDPHEPKATSVLQIAEALAVAPPSTLGRPRAFAEPDVSPLSGETPAELAPRTPDQSLWRVESRALELAGVLPGDLLLLDAAEEARAGDLVVAQLYDFDHGAARTRVRYYDGAYLSVRTMDPALAEAAVPVGGGVRIVGPIRALSRRMR